MTKRSPAANGAEEFNFGSQVDRKEMTLSALLNDDVVRLVMMRDGVTPSDIRALTAVDPLVTRKRAAGAKGPSAGK